MTITESTGTTERDVLWDRRTALYLLYGEIERAHRLQKVHAFARPVDQKQIEPVGLKAFEACVQTGSDFGGILAAKECGLETGGYMPENYRTENGFRPEYRKGYGALPINGGYADRTKRNACESDGTVLFYRNAKSPGTKLTFDILYTFSKPYFPIHIDNAPNVDKFLEWLKENKIVILNVAGHRESVCPGIQEFTRNYLTVAFKILDVTLAENNDLCQKAG